MNEEALEKYHKYLRGKYRKKRTENNYYFYAKQCLDWIDKPLDTITKDDLMEWKEYIINKYMPNGNVLMIAWEVKNRGELVAAGRNPETITDRGLWVELSVQNSEWSLQAAGWQGRGGRFAGQRSRCNPG